MSAEASPEINLCCDTITDRRKIDKWCVQQYRMTALQEPQDNNVNPHSHDKPKVQRRCMIKKTHIHKSYMLIPNGLLRRHDQPNYRKGIFKIDVLKRLSFSIDGNSLGFY